MAYALVCLEYILHKREKLNGEKQRFFFFKSLAGFSKLLPVGKDANVKYL